MAQPASALPAVAAASAAASSSSASTPSLSDRPLMSRRAAAAAARSAEPQSWGETLQRYAASRTAVAAEIASPPRPSQGKFGTFNASRTVAPFDPVRQVYRSSEAEQAVHARESSTAAEARIKARWTADHAANHKGYDILSGQTLPSTNTAVLAALAAKDSSHRTVVEVRPDGTRAVRYTPIANHPSARDWDVISHAIVIEGGAERLAKAEQRFAPLHSRAQKELRDVNVITNRYQLEPHDQRAAREKAANEEQLRQKFFAQNHYNPVTLQFVHPGEEARYQTERLAASAAHGQIQQNSLPPRVKVSEGLLYDIVAPGRVKDQAQLEVYYEQPAARSRESKQLKTMVERNLQERDVANDDSAATRAYNRVSGKRFEETLRRGYDITNNQSFEQQAWKPHAAARPPGWIKRDQEVRPAGK